MNDSADVVVMTDGLTKRFGDFTAVDNVSFRIRAGEVLGYLGPNGSGKTTTIRMLLGLLLPSDGQSQVLGFDSVNEAEEIRQRVGYMSQKFALYDELTSLENLTFYAGVYGIRDRDDLAATIHLLGLEQIQKERASDLPLGWRQRLALATAIVHKPTILFLDEPTSGVDPGARRDFWDLIYELAESGVTILVTTHYMDEAEYCTRVGFMRRGRLMAVGTPTELKESEVAGAIWRVYCTPLLASLDLLETLPAVRNVSLSGDHLRVIMEEKSGAHYLEQEMGAAGFHDVQIKETAPTLEDVFLSLAGN
ncbi:MAG: ABC transporter ATP-binding protein [Anaerolineales bacterium]